MRPILTKDGRDKFDGHKEKESLHRCGKDITSYFLPFYALHIHPLNI